MLNEHQHAALVKFLRDRGLLFGERLYCISTVDESLFFHARSAKEALQIAQITVTQVTPQELSKAALEAVTAIKGGINEAFANSQGSD